MATIRSEFGQRRRAPISRIGAGRNAMKRFYFHLAVAVVAALGGSCLTAPASAAPPTVVPSPGYDARLQEQRAAQSYYAPAYDPVVRHPRPVHRHHAKPVH
jgi:hypothetical protein